GDLDIVFANATGNSFYLNDGKGSFQDVSSRLPPPVKQSSAVVAVDVDGDRDLDLVFGEQRAPDTLLLNDGKGFFKDVSSQQLRSPAGWTTAVVAADVDLDGHPDLVLAKSTSRSSPRYRLHLNDGKGRFVYAGSRLPQGSGSTGGIALADLDLDGDLDLIGASQHVEILWNRLRQIEAPLVLRLSVPVELRLMSKAGFAAGPQLAFPFLHLEPQKPEVLLPPIGRWRIKLAGQIALPPLLLPSPAGQKSLVLPLPRLPVLIGKSMYAQSWIFDSLDPWTSRFSNALVERIHP
ncbi:MAG: FG-GAP repeat domain-containing protein, partial [Planctomycetota bacterium]